MTEGQRGMWAIDTEWGYVDNRVDEESAWEPVVLCAVNLDTGQRLHFWGRNSTGLREFFREHADDLFICHYAIAEMKYLLRLGIPLPANWCDTFLAYRFLHNSPGQLDAGLSHALHSYGLKHVDQSAKQDLREKIVRLAFNADDPSDRQQVIDYCYSDCDGGIALYKQLGMPAIRSRMLHWVEYLKAIAKMELRGVPFDLKSYRAIERQSPQIRDALTRDINRTWPVYRDHSFSLGDFIEWCRSVDIAWPTKKSPVSKQSYYPLDRETFKDMSGRHPFIEHVRQVRNTIASLGKRTLAVDRELRRHFFSTSVFRAVTARNQPKKFVFSGPKWMRYLIVPESAEHVLVYVDYVAQEIAVAAALSSDVNMRAIYEAEDCHMAFAIRANAAPSNASKATHSEIRKRYKAVNLGVQYGQTAIGIAQKLGISQSAAENMVYQHRREFSVFWRWSDDLTQGSFDRGWISTSCGWRSLVPKKSNSRTWQNWPMQATGSDIMRLTITYLDQQNVQLLAPIHDGFLMTCRRSDLNALREAVNVACSAAVEQVIPGFPLRWETSVYADRFEDPDGAPLWTRLQSILNSLPTQNALQ
ncbi:MAG: hypothetical protein H0T51_00805 [Pirellulales bacterium]|nr:hypothetical protein [Pirellulales bacterium]